MNPVVTNFPGLTIRELEVDAPLDHRAPDQRRIKVFARIATATGGQDKPYLVFLQGGPGFEAPRPALPGSPAWLPRALQDFQVVFLDQRGTGRSTPVHTRTRRTSTGAEAALGDPLAGLDPADQADWLRHLRADEIVNDCELVRETLGAKTWTVLGQSFGGFTTLHYLCVHPESLAGALLTGGLSAVGHPIDDIYSATWQIMIEKSQAYYRRFPGDRDRVRELSKACERGEIVLPGGDVVSPERFRTVGGLLGRQGGAEVLHYLLGLGPQTTAFSHDLADLLPFTGRNPLYSVLHESSYADGVVTGWSAERTMPDQVRDDVTLLAGEHLHRSVFTEDQELAPFGGAADLLAEHHWNQLYPLDRLAQAEVPVAAAVYHHDAFVPTEFALETAALLPDCRTWVTSEYEHNGLRADEAVLDHLIGLLSGSRWL